MGRDRFPIRIRPVDLVLLRSQRLCMYILSSTGAVRSVVAHMPSSELISDSVSDRTRLRVSIEETTGVPLGFLSPRNRHFLFRSIRSTRLQWSVVKFLDDIDDIGRVVLT